MAQRSKQHNATPNYRPAWVAVYEWEGFSKGDPIAVDSEFAERGSRWEFSEAHIKDGRAISIVVVGGREGRRSIRAFRPEHVREPNATVRRKVAKDKKFKTERAEALKAQRAEKRAIVHQEVVE